MQVRSVSISKPFEWTDSTLRIESVPDDYNVLQLRRGLGFNDNSPTTAQILQYIAYVRDHQPTLEHDTPPTPVPVEPDTAYIRALICSYPWNCAEALAVAYCESKFQQGAQNGTSWGVFQINYPYHMDLIHYPYEMLLAEQNVAVAYQIWKDSGWEPWSCQP